MSTLSPMQSRTPGASGKKEYDMEFQRQKDRIKRLKIRQDVLEYKYIDDAQTDRYIEKIKDEIRSDYEKYKRTSERATKEVCGAFDTISEYKNNELKDTARTAKRRRIMKDIDYLPVDIRTYGGVYHLPRKKEDYEEIQNKAAELAFDRKQKKGEDFFGWASLDIFQDCIGDPKSLVEFYFNLHMAYRPEFWNRRDAHRDNWKLWAKNNTNIEQKYYKFFTDDDAYIPLPKVWTNKDNGLLDSMMIDGPARQELKKWGIKYKIETSKQRNLNGYIPLDVVHSGDQGHTPVTRWRFDRREMKTYLKTMNNQDGLPAPIQGPERGGETITPAMKAEFGNSVAGDPVVVATGAAQNEIRIPNFNGTEFAYPANNTSFWEQRFIEGGAMLEKNFDETTIGQNQYRFTDSISKKILDPIGMPNICTFRALQNTETGDIIGVTNDNGPVLGGNVAWPMLSTSAGLRATKDYRNNESIYSDWITKTERSALLGATNAQKLVTAASIIGFNDKYSRMLREKDNAVKFINRFKHDKSIAANGSTVFGEKAIVSISMPEACWGNSFGTDDIGGGAIFVQDNILRVKNHGNAAGWSTDQKYCTNFFGDDHNPVAAIPGGIRRRAPTQCLDYFPNTTCGPFAYNDGRYMTFMDPTRGRKTETMYNKFSKYAWANKLSNWKCKELSENATPGDSDRELWPTSQYRQYTGQGTKGMEIERQKQQHFKAVLRANRYIYGNFGDEVPIPNKRPAIWTSQQKVGKNGLSFGINAIRNGGALNKNQLNDFLSFYQSAIFFCDEAGYYWANHAIRRILWLFNIEIPSKDAPQVVAPGALVIGRAMTNRDPDLNTRMTPFLNSLVQLIANNQEYTNARDLVASMCLAGGKLNGHLDLNTANNILPFDQNEIDALRTISTLMILSRFNGTTCPDPVPQEWAYKLVTYRKQILAGNINMYPNFIAGGGTPFLTTVDNMSDANGGWNGRGQWDKYSYCQDLYAYREARHGAFKLYGRTNGGNSIRAAEDARAFNVAPNNLADITARSYTYEPSQSNIIADDIIGANSVFGRETVQAMLRRNGLNQTAAGVAIIPQVPANNGRERWGQGGLNAGPGGIAGVPIGFMNTAVQYKRRMQLIHDECEGIYMTMRTDDTDQRLYSLWDHQTYTITSNIFTQGLNTFADLQPIAGAGTTATPILFGANNSGLVTHLPQPDNIPAAAAGGIEPTSRPLGGNIDGMLARNGPAVTLFGANGGGQNSSIVPGMFTLNANGGGAYGSTGILGGGVLNQAAAGAYAQNRISDYKIIEQIEAISLTDGDNPINIPGVPANIGNFATGLRVEAAAGGSPAQLAQLPLTGYAQVNTSIAVQFTISLYHSLLGVLHSFGNLQNNRTKGNFFNTGTYGGSVVKMGPAQTPDIRYGTNIKNSNSLFARLYRAGCLTAFAAGTNVPGMNDPKTFNGVDANQASTFYSRNNVAGSALLKYGPTATFHNARNDTAPTAYAGGIECYNDKDDPALNMLPGESQPWAIDGSTGVNPVIRESGAGGGVRAQNPLVVAENIHADCGKFGQQVNALSSKGLSLRIGTGYLHGTALSTGLTNYFYPSWQCGHGIGSGTHVLEYNSMMESMVHVSWNKSSKDAACHPRDDPNDHEKRMIDRWSCMPNRIHGATKGYEYGDQPYNPKKIYYNTLTNGLTRDTLKYSCLGIGAWGPNEITAGINNGMGANNVNNGADIAFANANYNNGAGDEQANAGLNRVGFEQIPSPYEKTDIGDDSIVSDHVSVPFRHHSLLSQIIADNYNYWDNYYVNLLAQWTMWIDTSCCPQGTYQVLASMLKSDAYGTAAFNAQGGGSPDAGDINTRAAGSVNNSYADVDILADDITYNRSRGVDLNAAQKDVRGTLRHFNGAPYTIYCDYRPNDNKNLNKHGEIEMDCEWGNQSNIPNDNIAPLIGPGRGYDEFNNHYLKDVFITDLISCSGIEIRKRLASLAMPHSVRNYFNYNMIGRYMTMNINNITDIGGPDNDLDEFAGYAISNTNLKQSLMNKDQRGISDTIFGSDQNNIDYVLGKEKLNAGTYFGPLPDKNLFSGSSLMGSNAARSWLEHTIFHMYPESNYNDAFREMIRPLHMKSNIDMGYSRSGKDMLTLNDQNTRGFRNPVSYHQTPLFFSDPGGFVSSISSGPDNAHSTANLVGIKRYESSVATNQTVADKNHGRSILNPTLFKHDEIVDLVEEFATIIWNNMNPLHLSHDPNAQDDITKQSFIKALSRALFTIQQIIFESPFIADFDEKTDKIQVPNEIMTKKLTEFQLRIKETNINKKIKDAGKNNKISKEEFHMQNTMSLDPNNNQVYTLATSLGNQSVSEKFMETGETKYSNGYKNPAYVFGAGNNDEIEVNKDFFGLNSMNEIYVGGTGTVDGVSATPIPIPGGQIAPNRFDKQSILAQNTNYLSLCHSPVFCDAFCTMILDAIEKSRGNKGFTMNNFKNNKKEIEKCVRNTKKINLKGENFPRLNIDFIYFAEYNNRFSFPDYLRHHLHSIYDQRVKIEWTDPANRYLRPLLNTNLNVQQSGLSTLALANGNVTDQNTAGLIQTLKNPNLIDTVEELCAYFTHLSEKIDEYSGKIDNIDSIISGEIEAVINQHWAKALNYARRIIGEYMISIFRGNGTDQLKEDIEKNQIISDFYKDIQPLATALIKYESSKIRVDLKIESLKAQINSFRSEQKSGIGKKASIRKNIIIQTRELNNELKGKRKVDEEFYIKKEKHIHKIIAYFIMIISGKREMDRRIKLNRGVDQADLTKEKLNILEEELREIVVDNLDTLANEIFKLVEIHTTGDEKITSKQILDRLPKIMSKKMRFIQKNILGMGVKVNDKRQRSGSQDYSTWGIWIPIRAQQVTCKEQDRWLGGTWLKRCSYAISLLDILTGRIIYDLKLYNSNRASTFQLIDHKHSGKLGGVSKITSFFGVGKSAKIGDIEQGAWVLTDKKKLPLDKQKDVNKYMDPIINDTYYIPSKHGLRGVIIDQIKAKGEKVYFLVNNGGGENDSFVLDNVSLNWKSAQQKPYIPKGKYKEWLENLRTQLFSFLDKSQWNDSIIKTTKLKGLPNDIIDKWACENEKDQSTCSYTSLEKIFKVLEGVSKKIVKDDILDNYRSKSGIKARARAAGITAGGAKKRAKIRLSTILNNLKKDSDKKMKDYVNQYRKLEYNMDTQSGYSDIYRIAVYSEFVEQVSSLMTDDEAKSLSEKTNKSKKKIVKKKIVKKKRNKKKKKDDKYKVIVI